MADEKQILLGGPLTMPESAWAEMCETIGEPPDTTRDPTEVLHAYAALVGWEIAPTAKLRRRDSNEPA